MPNDESVGVTVPLTENSLKNTFIPKEILDVFNQPVCINNVFSIVLILFYKNIVFCRVIF